MEDGETISSFVVFSPSAFKHHETETDIYRAIETKIYEGRIKGQDNKFAIVGFNTKGNPIEVRGFPKTSVFGKATLKIAVLQG
jgi:hypothetical protein